MKRMFGSFAASSVLLGAPLLLLAIACPAWAANDEVCVANDSEFAQALANARYWPPTTIKLVQGTYHFAQTNWSISSKNSIVVGGTKLLGGYSAQCAGRDIALG